jgi:hypothetical protein
MNVDILTSITEVCTTYYCYIIIISMISTLWGAGLSGIDAGSNLDWHTDYPDWGFSWGFSFPPGKFRDDEVNEVTIASWHSLYSYKFLVTDVIK